MRSRAARRILGVKTHVPGKIRRLSPPRARSAARARQRPGPATPAASPAVQESPAPNAFPVVGVGASAGGLEAFRSFLKALPPDTGMAYVLVQHLHPRHESILAELLSSATRMPVSEVKRDVRVERDHVYIITPPHDIEIGDGQLHLVPRTESGSQHMPIDRFLRTLAEVQKNRAIGVILSGTASDGTLGLKAIKAQGGISFAQTPETAQYEGMPRSAIAAGVVDGVLPPEEIADELARLGRHPYVAHPSPDAPHQPVAAFGAILGSVSRTTGTDFSSYRRAALERRISRRMALGRVETLEDYARRLEDDPNEAGALYGDWLASVTSFFRHPEALRAAVEDLLPRVAREKAPGAAVRLWMPGCATGEEVYSLAISLLERADALRIGVRFQVFATDINPLAVQTARVGVYLESIAQDVSSERLALFFDKLNGHYRITPRVRGMCVFARHDLLKDPPYSRIDLVSCGGLLHPLEPAALKKALSTVHYALQPGGVLMVAPSEGLGGTALFAPRDPAHGLYSRTDFVPQAALPLPGLAAGMRGDATPAAADAAREEQIVALETQLQETREALHTLFREYDAAAQALQASNEETLSANEELQNINEELQTAREQVQSANEEMTTLNAELNDRNRELGRTADDLVGLLASLDIPIVMISPDLVLRRFTPAAESLLNLIPKDVGRPLDDLRTPFDAEDLPGKVREVIEGSPPVDRLVSDARGRSYALRIRPHRSHGGAIDGAVMVLLDILGLAAR
jgi:two-component system, chemotaxis family, CheB/CheR fusion protein